MKNKVITKGGEWKVSKELVGNPVEEWYEFRVYCGKKLMGSFKNPKEAKDYVMKHRAA